MFYCSQQPQEAKEWQAKFEKAEHDTHYINHFFVPHSIVELGPGMAEGGVEAAKRQAIYGHILMQLGFFETVESLQPPTHEALEMLDARYFLRKAQLQTWDTVRCPHSICFLCL